MNNQTTKPQPEPLFRKGSVVRYKASLREKFKESHRLLQKKHPHQNLGNQPIYNLMIYESPRWDNLRKTYIYDYEYGHCLTSEGSALETDLEWGHIGTSGITIY